MALLETYAFAQLPISYSTKKSLIDRYQNPKTILDRAKSFAGESPEEEKLFRWISSKLDLVKAERQIRQLSRMKMWGVGYNDPDYPYLLSQIPDPPLVLFGKGTLPPSQRVTLGFVGPRKPSTYGARIAKMLALDLAREEIVLVSGLARGIDAIAHESALKMKVPTVAVIACGLDRVYPPEHAHLQSRIEAAGAVVTEFDLGTPPLKENFPRRNRIISGLSKGVLLVEAAEKSGAKITAQYAVEQGRDVFALPGPVDSSLSFWPNRMIQEGAKLITTSHDVLTELIPNYVAAVRPKSQGQNILSEGEAHLLGHFEMDAPISVDELMNKESCSVSEVVQTLLTLEMRGIVAKQPDARYILVARL